jgi:hypothetical protein
VVASEPHRPNKEIVNRIKNDMKFQYLIDKYCQDGGCAEIIYSNDFYLTNIFNKKEIID